LIERENRRKMNFIYAIVNLVSKDTIKHNYKIYCSKRKGEERKKPSSKAEKKN
jgi:hypothetical protein